MPHENNAEGGFDQKLGADIDLIALLNLARKTGPGVLSQVGLYARLLAVEWQEEKNRWRAMLAATILGFACLLCALLSIGALVVAVTWNTEARIWAVLGLVFAYGAGTAIAIFRLQHWVGRGSQAFAASREEFAADIALIKSQL